MKDFDFNPEYSTSDLVGGIVVLRDLADSKLWKKKPFDPAHALVDLHMLANNAAGEFKTEGGGTIAYQPGWCIWSNRGLAERWGWRQESVEGFLKQLEELEVVRRHATGQRWKAIELVHWRSVAGASPEHERSVVGDGGELGDRSKELGEAPPRVITLESAWKYFEGVGAGYTKDQVQEQWLYYDAMRCQKTGEWQRPTRTGAMVRISDWRSELANALLKFASSESGPNGSSGVSASVAAVDLQKKRADLQRQLRELEEQVEQDRNANLPVAGADREKLKKLRAELEALNE